MATLLCGLLICIGMFFAVRHIVRNVLAGKEDCYAGGSCPGCSGSCSGCSVMHPDA